MAGTVRPSRRRARSRRAPPGGAVTRLLAVRRWDRGLVEDSALVRAFDLVALLALRAHADRGRLRLGLDDRELDVLVLVVRGGRLHEDGAARHELRAEHEVRQRVLDVALDGPA